MDWVKRNKLASLIIAILLFLVLRNSGFSPLNRTFSNMKYGVSESQDMAYLGAPSALRSSGIGIPPVSSNIAPTERQDRLVVQESSMSLLVKDVREMGDKVIEKAKEVGGFMISSSLTTPEDAPYASISVRVPADKLKEALDYYRNLAVKVASENLYGQDVTDEYVDIEARLESFAKIKAKYEEILDQAVRVSDLLEVNRELVNLQDQIDALKGRQKYLEQTAKLARITVYLSTDELALPYAPTPSFRPAVVLKQAVRSLVATLRSLATALIWLVVYLPVGVLLLLGYWFLKKVVKKQKS